MSDLLDALKNRHKAMMPEALPIPGDPVKMWGIYIWGVPHLVGSPKVPMPCIFTAVDPTTGRANGWAFADPSMKGDDGHGNLTQFPPLVPFENAPYTKDPEKGCWMHRDEFLEAFAKIQKEAVEAQAASAEEG